MVGEYAALARRHGIPHVFRLELELRRIVSDIVPKYKGKNVRGECDNCIAHFPDADNATGCAVEIMRRVASHNASRSRDSHIRLAIAMDRGQVEILGADIAGRVHERSFHLATKVAQLGEVLMTKAVKASKNGGEARTGWTEAAAAGDATLEFSPEKRADVPSGLRDEGMPEI